MELKSKEKILSYEEILEKLFKIEIEVMKIHSLSYELNADSFTNTEYMNWFNYSKSKVSSMISKSFSEMKESIKNNNERLINEYLMDKFGKIEIESKKDIKEFLNEYKNFLLNYKEISNYSSDALAILIDFIESKRPDLYKTCYSTLLEKKKLEEKNKDSVIDKLKNSLNKEKERNEKLDQDLKTKEDELNDLESEINKQKRSIKELNEKIAELDQIYKNLN